MTNVTRTTTIGRCIRRRAAGATRGVIALAVIAVVATLVVPAGAGDGAQSPRERQREVRERKAQVAAELDVLQAEQDEVEAALDALADQVAAERAALSEAERAASEAQAALEQAEARVARAEEHLAEIQDQVTQAAIDIYVGADRPGMLSSTDANELAKRDAYVDMTQTSKLDLIDRVDAARAELDAVREEAAEAARVATARRDEVASRLSRVDAAKAEQQAVADRVNARVERRLSEAANLADLDEELSREIVAAERALAARAPGSNGGSTPVSGGNVPLRNVRGFTVHAAIADQFDAMLGAAEADGYHFGGGAYRDPADQWRLRRAHCPDPANSPPSACSPPTARPGQSMHEQGKAIDFTYNGSLIRSRSNPGFQWLAANAGRYGFHNLPSEPWHWSVNGK